jgi:hypothetical protein
VDLGIAVDLFNKGDYYQAHDVLEELWHSSSVRPNRLPCVSRSLALFSQGFSLDLSPPSTRSRVGFRLGVASRWTESDTHRVA